MIKLLQCKGPQDNHSHNHSHCRDDRDRNGTDENVAIALLVGQSADAQQRNDSAVVGQGIEPARGQGGYPLH